jgi:hypothetical protein
MSSPSLRALTERLGELLLTADGRYSLGAPATAGTGVVA